MAWYRCGMNGTYNATTVLRSGVVCNYVANVGGVPLARFIANITPIQAGSGDPSPSNPRAISGVSEVITHNNGSSINQWDEQWELGSFDASGQPIASTTLIRSKNYVHVSSSTDYYVKSPVDCVIYFYDEQKAFISSRSRKDTTITTPANARWLKFRMGSAYGTTYNNDVSINYPATDTAYHAYTGQTATINLGGTYYGGTLNVGTGVLTVDYLYTEIDENSDITWRASSNVARIDVAVPYLKPRYGGKASASNYLRYTAVTGYDNVAENCFGVLTNSGDQTATALVWKVTGIESKNDMITWLATHNLQFITNMATPQTYQLTPAQIEQLLGENNVWADSGDSEVDFFKIIRT